MNRRDMTPEDYEQLVEALRTARHSLPLNEDEIRSVAQHARIGEALRGEIVMQQGGDPDALYFIISGQLRSADTSGDEPLLLNYHAAKSFVGEQGMLYNQPRVATIDVIHDATLAIWDRSAFNRLVNVNSQFRPYLEDLYKSRETRARAPFPGKQWDEVTLFRSGKHPVMLIIALIGPVLLLLVSLFVLVVLLAIDAELSILIGIVVGVPLAISLVWGAYNFINWRDDEYIVTSKRVIHIERFVIYGEKRDEAPLIRVQDVTLETSNFWERLLDFYDLTVKTAGAGTLVFVGVRNAEQAKKVIFDERAKAWQRREAADIANIRKELSGKMRISTPDVKLPVDTLVPTTGVFTESKVRHLPPLLDYLWPRMTIVKGDTITWRKHWFIWLKKTWLALMMFLAFLSLTFLALLGLPPFGDLDGGSVVLGLVLVVATLAAFVWYIYRYDDWYRDVYIVTGDRIIDVESSSFRLQGEERREGTFDNIQNITYVIPGFFNNLLNLGNVTIETAGTAATFTFDQVFNPSAVQQEIVNRMVAYQEERSRRERVREDTKLAVWFGEYFDLTNSAE